MTTEAERIACLEAQLEGVKEAVEQSRRERQAQMKEVIEKLDTLNHEVAEYRGAIVFGKWLAGTMIALGIPAGFLVWLGVPHK